MIKAFLLVALLAGLATGKALPEQLKTAGDNAPQIQSFLDAAEDKHGEFGKRTAQFLVQGMPKRDLQTLQQNFLLENLALALQAREKFPWGKAIPDEVFFNDVLPYASLDETREAWRPRYYEQASKIVADCQTPTEAVQALNKNFFNLVNVHYNTGRKRPNQSPAESQELGMATCTGLSIILVDACRAVGVPARVAGTPLWTNKRGNHTWIEIWDDGTWYFTGADEYDAKGLDRGWFTGDASKAQADDWKHAIWATSWRKSANHFPMVWNLTSRSVPAVNVTARYARSQNQDSGKATIYFRVAKKPGGKRLPVSLEVVDQTGNSCGIVRTKAGQADLNDMPSLNLSKGGTYRVKLQHGDEQRQTELKVSTKPEVTLDLNWTDLEPVSLQTKADEELSANLQAIQEWLSIPANKRSDTPPTAPLTRKEAAAATDMIWNTLKQEQADQRQKELEQKIVKAAGKQMKYHEKVFGDAPAGTKSLWISMHGGGGAPPQVNEQQWNNQIRLYKPKEGIVVAPRAPTDTWNLWHQSHIDPLFTRLIENYVAFRGVNPDRVYLMGYSAGGDGVYQLAPRMADQFAAAAMMAGHPNDASPLGLRNLPFMIFMGGKDGAYKRNEIAAEWGEKLASLQQADPQGYQHKVTIYPDYGHWMQGKDAEGLPWMASHSRQTWPKKIVWHQSSTTHDRFYWLAVPEDAANLGQIVRAEVADQQIDIITEGELSILQLRLSDELLDLDQAIEVTLNGKPAYSGKPSRSAHAILDSLTQRMDPTAIATAHIELNL